MIHSALNPLPYFPTAFVDAVVSSLQANLPNNIVLHRPLRSEDPGGVIGVWAENWVADEDSFVMGQNDPVVTRYLVRVRNLIKATDEEYGRGIFSVEAKAIRVILYRDPDLRVRLAGLQEEMMSTVERVKKYTVARQDYMSAQMSGAFNFLATTDVRIETETTLL